MVDKEQLGALFGYAGMVMTFVYFLSPVPTCLQIHKSKDVQEFSVVPYVVGVVNCSLWVYWSIVTMEVTSQNLTPNLLINGIGAVQFVCYVSVFMLYSKT
ncbi:SWEET7B [Symbiodinium natans]|uniref:SWEET7B protein n=1 Tax=Symbiodinium natans TaxID=878477 RepID=A0A812I958_9DINO|nr:SWEET7B [Symbiodinium natans]